MILIGALLLLIVVTVVLASLDLRFIDKLQRQRAAARAMPSLHTLLDRSPVADLASENAVLNRRVNQLEKKIELLQSAPPAATASVSPLQASGAPTTVISPFADLNGNSSGGNNQTLGSSCPATSRVEITAEEILFLTGGLLEPSDRSPVSTASRVEAEFKRFEAYFPANGDLVQYAHAPGDLIAFVQSAVIRALRLEGFAINSESVADEFLAKLANSLRFSLPLHAPDIRGFLARELMTYIAVHPQKQVRGRGA